MSVTAHGQEQLRGPNQPEAYLVLITILSPTPRRIVNNNVDIISRGDTFIGLPFEIEFSQDDGESIQQISIYLDNISLEEIEWIRTLTTPVPILIETIFSGTPEIVERSISNMVIRLIDYDAFSITSTVSADDDLNQSVPSDIYSALEWQGLY